MDGRRRTDGHRQPMHSWPLRRASYNHPIYCCYFCVRSERLLRVLNKLFKTSSIEIVKHCQEYFDFEIPSALWAKRVPNPLEFSGNYSATSNNMKLVHWPLMGGLLHLVQQGRDWARPQLVTLVTLNYYRGTVERREGDGKGGEGEMKGKGRDDHAYKQLILGSATPCNSRDKD